jgi:hypothetical protein
MKLMPRLVWLAGAFLLLAPAPSRAAFHYAVIDEVMSGAGGDSHVQYVEIRTLLATQNSVCHSRLTVFKCSSAGGGSQVLIDDLGGAAANPCLADTAAGHRWIMASPSASAFLAKSGITPDFTWDDGVSGGIPTACGMICWGAPGAFGLSGPPEPPTWDATVPSNYVDCLAYGPYDGTAEPFGNAASMETPGGGTFSLTRTGDSGFSNTFHLACPTPTASGAGQTPGSFGPCTVPASTTTTVTTVTTTTSTSFPPGAGEPVAGTKLLLKDNPSKPAKRGLMLVAKDAATVADDPTQLGGSLRVFTAAGDAFDTTYLLPASHWKPIGKPSAPKGFKFVDAAGPIKSVIVKPGKLAKALGRGAALGHTLGANPDPVAVLLATGAKRECMSFGGGKFVAGKKYLATKDPAPAACP